MFVFHIVSCIKNAKQLNFVFSHFCLLFRSNIDAKETKISSVMKVFSVKAKKTKKNNRIKWVSNSLHAANECCQSLCRFSFCWKYHLRRLKHKSWVFLNSRIFFIGQFFNIFLKSDTIKRYGTLCRCHCQQSNKNFASKSICPVESNRNEAGQLNEIYIQSMSLVILPVMACEDVTDISDRLKFSANIGRFRTVFIQSNIS